MKYLLFSLACFGTLTSTVFLGMVFYAAMRFCARRRREKFDVADQQWPPVTLLKPLHGAEPGLRAYLESFFAIDYPEFEMLFCAREESDAGLQMAREVAALHPEVKVRFMTSGTPPWPNAKCYSLYLMAKEAAHDLLVITDSDVRVEPHFLRAVIAPMALDPAIGGSTCIYRGMAEGMGLWGKQEGLGMSVEMTAGVLVAEMLEGMKFMLGPTMVVRKAALAEAGGFESMSDYYADDFILGNLVARKHTVTLSTHVIDHCIVNDSFATNFRHQWNWMKSTRFSRPSGHFGTVLTFATPFGLLGLLGAHLAGLPMAAGVALFAWSYLSRVLLCVIAGGMVINDPDAWRSCWLYPLRDFFGFIYWAASYTSRTAIWRGDLYVLEEQGRLRRVNR